MKTTSIFSILVALLFFTGCASNGGSEPAAAEEAAPTGTETSMNDGSGEKTAYEGSTGTGLLMERYKSGRIEGYRD